MVGNLSGRHNPNETRFLEGACESGSESSDRPRANTSVVLFMVCKSRANKLKPEDRTSLDDESDGLLGHAGPSCRITQHNCNCSQQPEIKYCRS